MKLDSQSIKDFFFYNVEKVIFGISLALLGAFFYFGMQTKSFDETPDSLVSDAKQATSFINKAANWELIDQHRIADTDVPERIERAKAPVDSSKYKIAGMSIIPKALQLRRDPPLPKVVDLEAKVIRAIVAVKSEKMVIDSLLELPIAKSQIDPDEEERDSGMSMMGPMGPSAEDMMAMEEAMAGMGPMGPMGGAQARKKKKKREKKDPQEDAEVDAWSGMPGVQQAVVGGLNPANNGISAANAVALKRNVVVVNALVEHRALWKQYEQLLSNSVGYYPKRDLPQYDFLQIERRTVEDGKPGPWSDVSEWINFEQAEYSPQGFISGPEVVPPGAYDPNLTNAIPSILGFDYRDYALHSKLEPRVFLEAEEEEEEVDAASILSGTASSKDEDEEEDLYGARQGNQRRVKESLVKSGGGMMGMMGGMGPDMDMGMMGPDMGMMGPGMFGMSGKGRSSANMTAYSELMDPALEPANDYKAIRFFDMTVKPNETAQYQYRVRLWLKDPNVTDPEASQGGFDPGDMGGMDMDMGMGMGFGRRGKKDEKKIFTRTTINFTMQDQGVRDRLKRIREEDDEDGDPVYYVSEIYPGQDMPTEVKVPEGFEYLRFSRPTEWSDPISVTVNGPAQEFFAESIDEARTAKVNDIEVPIEEPKVALVAEVEGEEFGGVDLAAKKQFAIGDMINFSEPITLMHPLALSVHFLEEANIKTDATLVDIIGGERLDIPRNEPIQYDLPGETLLMTADGTFKISNDIEDRTQARSALRLPDEKAEYGRKKRKKKRGRRDMEMEMDPFSGMGP